MKKILLGLAAALAFVAFATPAFADDAPAGDAKPAKKAKKGGKKKKGEDKKEEAPAK